MSVDYLLFFAVCQAASVHPDRITLPITSLSYKSLPTYPKEISLSFPTTENVEISSDAKLVEPITSPKIPSNYYFSENYNQRPIGPIGTSSPSQVGKPVSLQNLNLNTATSQVTTLPVINLPRKIENIISNNYITKVINDRNDNTVNLKYNLPVVTSTMPYSTYKVNNVNTPAIYINCNKQKHFRPEISTLDTNKLEVTHLIPERDSTLKQEKNIPNKISETNLVPDLSVNNLQQQNISYSKVVKPTSVEKQKMRSNEIPNSIYKDCESKKYPINNIVFSGGSSFSTSTPSINTLNSPIVSGKISITPNVSSTDNKVDLTVTPSVKIGNSKINSSPCQMTESEFENMNDITAFRPNIEPSNHILGPVPTYFCAPRELPKVYQLPKVYTNAKITPVYPSTNLSPASLVYKESDTYNYVRCKNTTDTTNAPIEFSSFVPQNTKTPAYTKAIKYVPSVPKYYTTPTHITEIPTLSQLPNVFTSPKVTYPSVSQRTDSNLNNIIYINMADISSPKSIDSRIPICNLNTEAKLQPIPVAGTSATPYYKSLDLKSIKSLNYIPVSNNVIYYQPEYTKPSIETQFSCPTNNLFPVSSDLCTSSISDSLNSIISSFTTGLLSAFYDIATQEENSTPMSPDSQILTNVLADTPSSIYSETSISLTMPVFLLSPPQLESPSFLPVPKVDLPLRVSEGKLLPKNKLKKPKPYISTIKINLLPSKEGTNDIIVML